MNKLWKKSGVKTDPKVTKYMISENLAEDKNLLSYDLQASIAHVKMLGKVELINKTEEKKLIGCLEEILKLEGQGKFKLKQENEDCHTAIENYLTSKLGDVGKKVHTGRSRNDQVLVATRLFTKDKLKEVLAALESTKKVILKFAKKHEFVPMPGYTHTQQAMPSSVGQWAGSFVEGLTDDAKLLKAAYDYNDQNPLGSASGFGTALPLDRNYTTKLLGFSRTQKNCLYCQNSRGKVESFTISALLQVMMTLGKIANDLVWFTSEEFDFFSVSDELTTGSSIMPQKKNLDIMEVLRANVSVVMSYQLQCQSVYTNLLSGYNKDLKIVKEPLIKSLKITQESLEIVALVFSEMKPKKENLIAAFSPGIFATDKANELVMGGMAFRDAYKYVGENLEELKGEDPVENIKKKKHLGATGNLGL